MAAKDHFGARRQCRTRHGLQFIAGVSGRERIAPEPLTHNLPEVDEARRQRGRHAVDHAAVAVRDAVKRRLIGFDAVKHLLLARIEKRPARLDLSRYPHLPQPFVAATRSADYATLLAGGAGHG